MAGVSWSPQALNDLDSIRRVIAEDAPRTAQRFVQRIFETAKRLERFPLSGMIVPEARREEFRQILVKKYRIIYRVRGEGSVEVVTVLHGARLLDLDILLDGES